MGTEKGWTTAMKLMEDRIRKDGIIEDGDVLKVGMFLNQQIDVCFISELAKEFYRLYKDEGVTKILTIEASGIAIATAAAVAMNLPVVFAKKSRASTQTGGMYTASVHSFTHGNTYDAIVPTSLLSPDDRILLIDDFLAHGAALCGLLSIVKQSGAHLCGCAIAIEKAFQGGGDKLRAEGIRIDSLACIASMSPEGGIVYR